MTPVTVIQGLSQVEYQAWFRVTGFQILRRTPESVVLETPPSGIPDLTVTAFEAPSGSVIEEDEVNNGSAAITITFP